MLKTACLIAIVTFVVTALFAQGGSTKPDTSAPTKVTGASTKTADGLEYWDIKVGSGPVATAGQTVKVHYTGWLTNGKKFDSSVDRGEPFTFPLGGGQVIKGWDEGVVGMKVGGKRKLVIPPSLGYGDQSAGTIPPNSTLIFVIQLVSVN